MEHLTHLCVAKVSNLENSHGWVITSATGLAVSLTYNRAIQLFFTPTSFLANNTKNVTEGMDNAPISLTYIADVDEFHPHPLTTVKRFFLQIIRAQLQCLQQSQTRTKDLLAFVGGSWDMACRVAEEADALDVSYITEPTIMADEAMAVHSAIILKTMRTKVNVTFEIKVRSGEGASQLALGIKSIAKVGYGETLNEKKMSEFLESRIKGVKGYGVWAQATRELEERLIARGRKA